MVDTHFKSEQNQFLHLDTEAILSPPLYILLGVYHTIIDDEIGNLLFFNFLIKVLKFHCYFLVRTYHHEGEDDDHYEV